MSAEAMKAFDKGRNTGSMFMLDLDVMKANKIDAESYVRLWITAWQSKLTNEELEIAQKHVILWHGQQAQTPANYPLQGIPSTTNQLLILAQNGKCGDEYNASTTTISAAEETQILSNLSGDVINNAQEDYYAKSNTIRKAMERFRHFATVALGGKLNGPFDQGLISSYNQLITWVYKKCNVTRTIESMADYFEDLDKAINDDNDTDCQSMKFRMVLNRMLMDGSTTPVPFPDIEGDTTRLTDKEKIVPSHMLLFLYNKWKKIDKKTWTSIEDEFRGELGGTNYTRVNWMLNKPRLYELIDQKAKVSSSRASINRAQADEESENEEDRMELEIEPGLILYVSPKSKAARQQNWKSKVQKYKAAAKRGQRPQNSNFQSNNNNRSNNSTTPASHWNCRMCPQQNGRPIQHKRGQKCPQNGFIPKRMIGSVQEDEKSNETETEKEQEKESINSVRHMVAPVSTNRFNYDSSDTDQSA